MVSAKSMLTLNPNRISIRLNFYLFIIEENSYHLFSYIFMEKFHDVNKNFCFNKRENFSTEVYL